MLTETVIFRATDELAVAIQQRAAEAGVTVSEYLRGIISECVDPPPRECVSPLCFNLASSAFFAGEHSAYYAAKLGIPLREGQPDPDPIDLMMRAAEGDTQAQRDLADIATLRALSGKSNVDPFLVLSEGLMFARMADRHHDPDDAMRVITMLALGATVGEGSAARELAGEAIARLELLADEDNSHSESSAILLNTGAPQESAEVMRIAQQYRARLTAREDV